MNVNNGAGNTLAVTPWMLAGFQTSPAISASAAREVLVNALGQTTQESLNAQGQTLGLQTPDGATQTWQRDFAGQPTSYTDQLGHTTTYTYQYGAGDGDLVQTVDPLGHATTYQYDPTFHQVTQTTDPLGHIDHLHLRRTGNPLTTTDPLGNTATETWSNGLLQSADRPAGSHNDLHIRFDAS